MVNERKWLVRDVFNNLDKNGSGDLDIDGKKIKYEI